MKKILLMIVMWLGFCFVAMAEGGHYNSNTVINNYVYGDSQAAKREVRAAASGQTNYKATSRIQWSVGAAFVDGESALNIGIGYQAGSVFIAGGVTDNTDTMFTSESDPLVTVNASGVF